MDEKDGKDGRNESKRERGKASRRGKKAWLSRERGVIVSGLGTHHLSLIQIWNSIRRKGPNSTAAGWWLCTDKRT